MISTKGRYALKIMIDLALNEGKGYVTLKEIASKEGISLKYLEQIISLLNKAGFLISLRGSNGGYKLAKKAGEYTAGDIIRTLEGDLAPISCLKESENSCVNKDRCTTLSFWGDFYKVVNDFLDNVTLEDLAKEAREKGL